MTARPSSQTPSGATSLTPQWPGAIIQFEDDVERNRGDLIRYWCGKRGIALSMDRRPTDAEKAQASQWIDRMFRTISPNEDLDDVAINLGWLRSNIAEAATRHGSRWVIIDPWNELEHAFAKGQTEAQYLNDAVRGLKRLARRYQILLIMLPIRMPQADRPPTLQIGPSTTSLAAPCGTTRRTMGSSFSGPTRTTRSASLKSRSPSVTRPWGGLGWCACASIRFWPPTRWRRRFGVTRTIAAAEAWPRLMRAETAARYVDEVSVEAFRRAVGSLYPEPIRVSGKGDRWVRDGLDEAIDRLGGPARNSETRATCCEARRTGPGTCARSGLRPATSRITGSRTVVTWQGDALSRPRPSARTMRRLSSAPRLLNRHLDAWRSGLEGTKVEIARRGYGTVAWLFDAYLKSPAFEKRVSKRSRYEYRRALARIEDMPTKTGGTVADLPVSSITTAQSTRSTRSCRQARADTA